MNAYYYYNVTGITNTDRSNMPESQKSLQAEAQLSDYRGQKQGRYLSPLELADKSQRKPSQSGHWQNGSIAGQCMGEYRYGKRIIHENEKYHAGL